MVSNLLPNSLSPFCKILFFETVAATEYHLLTHGKVKLFNAIIISALMHYVSENKKGCETIVFSFICAYNVQVHRTIKLSSFSLASTRLAPGRINIVRTMPLEIGHIDSPVTYRLRLIHRATLLGKMADTNSEKGRPDIRRTTIDMSGLNLASQRALRSR